MQMRQHKHTYTSTKDNKQLSSILLNQQSKLLLIRRLLHFKNPSKSLVCFRILLHSQRNIHPSWSNLLQSILSNNDRRVSYRIDISNRSSHFRIILPQHLLILFRFNVKERKRSSKPIFSQIWYRFNNDMIRLRHQNITAHNQHNISAQ